MRTTTALKRELATATPSAGGKAPKRGRARPGIEAPVAGRAEPPVSPEPASVGVSAVRMLKLEEGLYALRIGRIDGNAGEIAGMMVPVAHVSAPFVEDGNGVEIVASFPRRGPWLEREGGTVIIRSPLGGGYVIVAVYGQPGEAAAMPALDLRRLDRPDDDYPAQAPASATGEPSILGEPKEVATEILLHIERAGDRLFPGRGWVGALGRKLRIEAFSIRPLERLAPADIEFKGFLPNGNETQWVNGGALCGTRGRRLPLIGFAVRVAPRLADRFEVAYQGSFFMSGISSVYRNGEPCRVLTGDDPLEAMNIRLIERAPDSEKVSQAD
jgi:hypothetical protein